MEALSDNMWSALVGAVVGAAIAHALDAARERRRNALATRRALLGEVLLLHSEWKASFIELQAARASAKELRRDFLTTALAQLTRLEGRTAQQGVTLIQAFSSRLVRAAFNKLRSRYTVAKDLFLATGVPDVTLRDVALKWLDDQAERLVAHASPAAHIETKVAGGVAWVGWGSIANRRWAERYEDLQLEDRKPPWQADVRLYLVGLRENTDEGQTIARTTLSKIADLNCVEHRRAVHVALRGLKNSFTVEITTCCEPLGEKARKALGIGKVRKRDA